jgi:alkanesulfonate monooxygenase SsuD/methylene tetrahydromethanopterin reductase-like flavin-dependent oxidoreductase (luciferase family)
MSFCSRPNLTLDGSIARYGGRTRSTTTGEARHARKGTERVNYGFVLPVTDPRNVIELSAEAETAGWDGVFVAEMIYGPDAWVTLAAAAMRTERIKLGTMLSPVARMRPWKIASETATLDRISNGRVILAVGLGAIETGYAAYGEVIDRKTRVELTEEALQIVTALWKGEPFSFQGKHYQVDITNLDKGMRDWEVRPVQTPRIPIWHAGTWPASPSMRRALKYDGLLPNVFLDGKHAPITVDALREMRALATETRGDDAPYDIIVEGESQANDPAEIEKMTAWEEAGGTWWIESSWSKQDDLEFLRNRISAGPPRGA